MRNYVVAQCKLTAIVGTEFLPTTRINGFRRCAKIDPDLIGGVRRHYQTKNLFPGPQAHGLEKKRWRREVKWGRALILNN